MRTFNFFIISFGSYCFSLYFFLFRFPFEIFFEILFLLEFSLLPCSMRNIFNALLFFWKLFFPCQTQDPFSYTVFALEVLLLFVWLFDFLEENNYGFLFLPVRCFLIPRATTP